MGGSRQMGSRWAALGAAIAVALLAGVAHAKPWAKWAPAPLASDSTYAALLARPADSLSASRLLWLAVQRDWRAQRDEEANPTPSDRHSITSPPARSAHPHIARRTDARFAALASRPYPALADSELAWLISENAAQIAKREAPSANGVGAGIFFGLLAGAGLAYWAIASALSHSHGFWF
jgi:hypothetical protein